jgi:DNA-binding response OmpR family regulator
MALTALSLPEIPIDGKYRILVVEDEPDVGRLVVHTLDVLGFECHLAPDGIAGLTAFHENDPHLVISDVMMPAMDGRELCRRIRETSAVPIIMLTALNSEVEELSSLRIGADDYLTKPFNPKRLVAHVAAQLRRAYRYQSPFGDELQVDGLSHKTHWATCEKCNYMGPHEKFEKESWRGEVYMVCPNCKNRDHIKISIN